MGRTRRGQRRIAVDGYDMINELGVNVNFQRLKTFFKKELSENVYWDKCRWYLSFNFLPISINVRRMLNFVKKEKFGIFFL